MKDDKRSIPMLPAREVELEPGRYHQPPRAIVFTWEAPFAARVHELRFFPKLEVDLGWIVESLSVGGEEQLMGPTPLVLLAAGVGEYMRRVRPGEALEIVVRAGSLTPRDNLAGIVASALALDVVPL